MDDAGVLLFRLHGELAATVVRDSAAAVQQELLACYVLIERMGRGVVCVPCSPGSPSPEDLLLTQAPCDALRHRPDKMILLAAGLATSAGPPLD